MKSTSKYFSRVEIRDTLKIDYYEVLKILDYLESKNLIEKENGIVPRYRWKR